MCGSMKGLVFLDRLSDQRSGKSGLNSAAFTLVQSVGGLTFAVVIGRKHGGERDRPYQMSWQSIREEQPGGRKCL